MNEPERNINSTHEEEIKKIKILEKKRRKHEEERRRIHEESMREIDQIHKEEMECLESNFCEDKEKIDNRHSENMKRINVDENIKKKEIKKENIGKDDLNKLLMVQDIIEGFWDENEITLQIIDKINDKFNIIESYVNNEDDIKDKKKVIFTTIVLYYFLNYMKDKFDELRLIINKGKKYLNSIGYPYDSIIQKTGI